MNVVPFPKPEPEPEKRKDETGWFQAAFNSLLGVNSTTNLLADILDEKTLNQFIVASFGEMTMGEVFAEVSRMPAKEFARQLLGINGDSDTTSA